MNNKFKNIIIRFVCLFIPNKKHRRNFRKKLLEKFIKFPHKINPAFILPSEPEVTVIIPVYNQYDFTCECLKSIAYYKPKISFEIIIADDASTDKTKNIEHIINGIRVVRTEGNYGFLKNVKNAITHAKGEYIFLMNNDMLVTEGWLDTLYETITTDNKIGIVGSLNLNIDGSIQEFGAFLDKKAHSHINKIKNIKIEELEAKEVQYCSGCSILFSKTDWENIGGFDDKFAPAYYEDTDFNFSMRYKLGKKIICQPKSQIYHIRSLTYSTEGHKLSERNRIQFLKKWGDRL